MLNIIEHLKSISANNMIKQSKKPEYDYEILFLQVIGICAVVLGHFSGVTTAINNIIPYYSWHMPFFIFISGVLFGRKANKRSIARTIYIKTKNLLIPALVVNLLYGIISLFMRNMNLVSYGRKFSIDSLLIIPFTHGYTFSNFISIWFFCQLYVIEIIFSFVGRLRFKNADVYITIIALFLSLYSSWYVIKEGLKNNDWFLLLIRTGFLSFFFSLGNTFSKHLDARFNKLKHPLITGIIVLLSYLIIMLFYQSNQSYNTRAMTFENYTADIFFMPQVFACFAIMFFVLISKSLSVHLQNSKFLEFFGSNIKSVVYHHQFVAILINCTALLLSCSGLGVLVEKFDVKQFSTKPWYHFAWGKSSVGNILYFWAPLLLPVIYNKAVQKIKNRYLRLLFRFISFCAVLAYIYIVGCLTYNK